MTTENSELEGKGEPLTQVELSDDTKKKAMHPPTRELPAVNRQQTQQLISQIRSDGPNLEEQNNMEYHELLKKESKILKEQPQFELNPVSHRDDRLLPQDENMETDKQAFNYEFSAIDIEEVERSVLASPTLNDSQKLQLKDRVIDYIRQAVLAETATIHQNMDDLQQKLDEAQDERDALTETLRVKQKENQDQDVDSVDTPQNEIEDQASEEKNEVKSDKGQAKKSQRTKETSKQSDSKDVHVEKGNPETDISLERSQHNFVELLADYSMQRRRHARDIEELQAVITRLRSERNELKKQVAHQLDFAYRETKDFVTHLTQEIREESAHEMERLENEVKRLKKQLAKQTQK